MPHPIPSRRSFLQTAAALGAAALLPVGRSAFGADASDPYAGLPMGLQSYTLRSMSFDKMLEATQNELHLHYVELYPNHMANMSPTQALAKLEAAGVKAVAYGVVHFSKDHDANRKLFEFGKAMGVKTLSADPTEDAFDSLDKLVEEYKISIAIHDHGPGHHWGKIDTIWNAVKDHHKLVGLCNDTGHFIRAGEDPLRACEVFKDRMFGMHFKDFKKDDKGKWEDCILGEGSLKVDAIVKFLLENNFQGNLALEYEGGDPVASAQKSLAIIQQSVKSVRKA